MSVDNTTTIDDNVTIDGDTSIDETESGLAAEAAPQSPKQLDTGTEVTFASLELPKPLLNVLDEAGVTTAFPIQAATIPDALIGRDVLGRGRTGSGKTLAFGLPTLTRLEGLRAKPRKPLALVLVPTRELAMQVEEALRPYARAMRLRIRSVYGGAPMRKQIDNLRYGVEMLVATPGRLSDLIEQGECELGEVDIAILDEADQMCDMGFLPHVCELMDQVAEGGQRLLFSATLDGAVDEIVKKYMNDPVLHEVDPQAGVVSTMSHHLLMVTPQHKAKVAAQIAGRHAAEVGNGEARSIFFVRTQMAVDRVTEQMRERGLPAAGLHGGMTQVARTKTLEDFKEGRTPVLIATDVAARGIHVDGIDLVVHLDPPRDSKDYLHRAGRTARAGQAGVVASLVLPKQRKQAQRLMNEAGVTAEELDAAPLGTGGRWETAGTALAELTGAREVPEPGDVPVFTLPVRERSARPRDGRDGWGGRDRRDGWAGRGGRDGERFGRDRYNRADRDRREGSFERRGPGFDRAAERDGRGSSGSGSGSGTSGERFGRDRFDRNGGGADRGGRGGAPFRRDFDRGSESARDGARGRDGERGGFDRGAARGGFPQRDGDARRDAAGDRFQGRRFERSGDGEPRFGRGERRDDAFPRRDREFGGDRRVEGRRFDRARPEERGGEKRGFEDRSGRDGRFNGRSSGGPGFREHGRDERGGSERNRGTDRSDRGAGAGAGFERDDRRRSGDRPRQGNSWAGRPHSN